MNQKNMEKATFAAGCFWGVEEAFKRLPGVVSTRVGYIGGKAEKPSYREVCTGSTGHVEACEILYNPEETSYGELLELFWNIHNPTQADGQGNDIGSQYLSMIFYHSQEQQKIALTSLQKEDASGRHHRPLATAILPAGTFWDAEEYHQKYLEKTPGGYCHISMRHVEQRIEDIVRKRIEKKR